MCCPTCRQTSSFMSRRLRFYLHKVISSSAFLSAQFYLVNRDTNLVSDNFCIYCVPFNAMDSYNHCNFSCLRTHIHMLDRVLHVCVQSFLLMASGETFGLYLILFLTIFLDSNLMFQLIIALSSAMRLPSPLFKN
jgi:hypothetical protein